MVSSQTLEGVVTAAGALKLAEKLHLPPGPVRVTLDVRTVKPDDDLLTILAQIWKERAASWEKGCTREEIDADVQTLRDELEEHALAVERLQMEALAA